jgi:hypothetical protein
VLTFFALSGALASLADAVGEAELAVGAGAPAGLGPGHALPYAAGGSAWRLASAATDARVAAADRADG